MSKLQDFVLWYRDKIRLNSILIVENRTNCKFTLKAKKTCNFINNCCIWLAKKGSCLAREPTSQITSSRAELRAKILRANFEPSLLRAKDFRASSEPSFSRAFSSYTSEPSRAEPSRAWLGPTPNQCTLREVAAFMSNDICHTFEWVAILYFCNPLLQAILKRDWLMGQLFKLFRIFLDVIEMTSKLGNKDFIVF